MKNEHSFTRRDFVKTTAAVATVAMVSGMLPNFAVNAGAAAVKTITLDNCIKMTPLKMAESSDYVTRSYKSLQGMAATISDSKIKAVVTNYLNSPKVTLLELYENDTSKSNVRQKLVNAGFLKPDINNTMLFPTNKGTNVPQPFYSAPGSGYSAHHSYPGGLATHVAVNTIISQALYDAYEKIYGYKMNRDIIIASQILHDYHKPWIFQWNDDASSFREYVIVDQGGHHVLSIAESLHLGVPAELAVAIACAHNHPGNPTDEAQVASWLKAAAILADVDPVKYGILDKDGERLPQPLRQEGFMTHLGDHDFVLTNPAARIMIEQLKKSAKSVYKMSDSDINGKPFNSLRNYLFSQITVKHLQSIYINGGEAALNEKIREVVTL